MRVFRSFRISPGFAVFSALFIAAEIERARYQSPLLPLVRAALLGALCWLTARLTADNQPVPNRGRAFALQIAGCAAVVIATGVDGAIFNHVLPESNGIPIWDSAFARTLAFLSAHMPVPLTQFGISNGIRNALFDDVPIAVLLLLCGIKLRDMGLGRFRPGAWKAAALWLTVPLAGFAVLIATHRANALVVGLDWASNLLQNGFTEEFLWRGAILGRIRVILRDDLALVAQALLFGAWHFGLDLHAYHGDIAPSVASMITNQALFGYAMGFLTLRTGNVVIASAFHLLSDAIGDFAWLSDTAIALF